jgi:hypothetical protein
MVRCFAAIWRGAIHLWRRVYGYLLERADRHVAEWAASLERKRRYTHPDEAKRYRQNH